MRMRHSEMRSVLTGTYASGEGMDGPMKNAAAAPEGDRDFLRRPWVASVAARSSGMGWISDRWNITLLSRSRILGALLIVSLDSHVIVSCHRLVGPPPPGPS
jgi:hypothetical protein